ncbi:antibiotic biosynthesis monooxygenase family protein [Streptomyces sp. NPDC050988]|uniref:antibiotic biosynthesis monooxygenase family protein n=1 Tax=Streptomyces sp. NPDC050988 TaxID=3365637 RepID=UPI0037B03BDA
MSDHSIAPVADGASNADAPTTPGAVSAPAPAPAVPVAAYEPPYYAVVFTSVKTEEAGREGVAGGYGETNERMEELVEKIPGYLGMDYAGSPGGLSITIGYFRDADAVEEWRTNTEHRAAQRRGRAEWYERYTLHVAKVERSHGFEREHG